MKNLDEFIHKLNAEIENLTLLNEMDPLSEISKISDELRNIDFFEHEEEFYDFTEYEDPRVTETYSHRISRRERFERIQPQNVDPIVETSHTKRSSSCYSYFTNDEGLSLPPSELTPKDARNLIPNHLEHEPNDEEVSEKNSFILRTLHENLRYYVITLAFLEKMLKGNTSIDEVCNALTKEPNEIHRNVVNDVQNLSHIQSPFEKGHRAFLQGLQRQHNLQVGYFNDFQLFY